MTTFNENDRQLVGILQKQGRKSVSELATLLDVTETAVRQRLTRLLAAELISREEVKLSRGRPNHMYSLTRKGRESAGQNFSDLATVVWDEVRAIEDDAIRSSVIQGIAKRLALKYKSEIGALSLDPKDPTSIHDRAKSIAAFFESRGIPMTVDFAAADRSGNALNSEATGGHEALLPVLNLHGCPYPGLAEKDDLICEMEQAMFSEMAGCGVGFNRCDHNNGDSDCCSFQLEEDRPLSSRSEPIRSDSETSDPDRNQGSTMQNAAMQNSSVQTPGKSQWPKQLSNN